jgi:ferric-dicitrate binding protein FerR (iron transport regulator)
MDEKLLFKYFRGETTSEEEDAILAWVEETPANRKEFKTAFMIFSGLAVYAAKPNAMPTAARGRRLIAASRRSAAESGGKSSVIVCVRQLPSY